MYVLLPTFNMYNLISLPVVVVVVAVVVVVVAAAPLAGVCAKARGIAHTSKPASSVVVVIFVFIVVGLVCGLRFVYRGSFNSGWMNIAGVGVCMCRSSSSNGALSDHGAVLW